MDTRPAGEHHQGEGERHGDAEAHLKHLDEVGVLKVCQNVSADIVGVEGHIPKEPNGDVDKGADIDGALGDLCHLARSGVGETGVHLEYIRLTRQSHGEDGEALEHSTRPPEVDLGHPLPRLQLWCGLENDSKDDEHVESDAGCADVLEAGDIPDEGEGEGHEEAEGGEDHQPEVAGVLQLSQVGDDWGTEVTHHHEEGDGDAHQVADNAKLYQQLPCCAESVERQVFKISSPCQ